MAFNNNLIFETKKKLKTSGAISLIFIMLISSFYLYLNNQLVNDQKIFAEYSLKVKTQIFLINDILILSEKVESEPSRVVLKKELLKEIFIYKNEVEKFQQWLLSEKNQNYEKLYLILRDKKVAQKTEKYLNLAKSIARSDKLSKQEINVNIRSIAKAASSGLGEILEDVTFNIENKRIESLKELEILSWINVLVILILFIVVWIYIYKSLFSIILSQDEKITDFVVKVESASKSKTNFLANISHEIRTPMTVIIGYIDLLKNDDLKRHEKEEAISLVSDNAHHLLSLINEILDISKIESNKVHYNFKDIELSEIFTSTYGLLKVKAEEKKIDFSFKNINHLPEHIYTDEKRLKQIIFNLVGNALKFTDEGFVKVESEYKEASDTLVVYVKDSGIGITAEQSKRLFRPFEQGNEKVNRVYGGTGLGLAISQSLARGLGGDLKILQTQVGKGTTFVLTIDAGTSETTRIIDTPCENYTSEVVDHNDVDLTGKKILIVDDAKENSRLFNAYLSSTGAAISLAHGGKDAVKQYQDTTFDLVLLDLQMPDIDGYQALVLMKKHNNKIPILALTAHAMDEERIKTKEAGFVGHLTKPITAEDLILGVFHHLKK